MDKPNLKPAIEYGRVSGDKQKRSGSGEAAQEDDCAEFAQKNGYEILGRFIEAEAVSGDAPPHRRPALMEAVGALKPGYTLLVAKRDRLGRDPIQIAAVESELKRRKCRLVSTLGEGTQDDSGESIFMRRIFDAVAEFELYRIRTRTASASAARRRRGERVGQSPYGWEPDPDGPRNPDSGRLTMLRQVEDEQRVLTLIRELRAAGQTLRQIAARLNELQIPTKRANGRGWSHSAVGSILATSPLWSPHGSPVQAPISQ